MMYEVLMRRYQKALEEDDLPDLVLVDAEGPVERSPEVFKELHIRGWISSVLRREEGGRSRFKGITTSGEKFFILSSRNPPVSKRSP